LVAHLDKPSKIKEACELMDTELKQSFQSHPAAELFLACSPEERVQLVALTLQER